MRILTLTKFYYPYRGGIETVCKNITDENLKIGIQSDVLCANTSLRNEDDFVEGSRVKRSARLFYLKSTSICPLMPWQLRTLVPNYDIIHVHFPDPMTALSLFLAKPNIPFVIHWHSDIIKQKKLMTLFGPLQNWCLENAKVIIVTSQNYLDNSEDLKPFRHKVKIIPIGIKAPSIKLNRKSSGKNILSVGRLTSYKGFQNLIDAATLLPEDYRVTIVGNGELKEVLQRQIKNLNLEQRVILAGSKSSEDLTELYQSSDLFVLPSTQKSEAFGVVLLEAMSYGLPIVACEIPGSGVPWVSKHEENGINVPINSPQELALAMQKIISSNELFAKMSHKSFERFQSLFTLDKMMNKIWEAYQF